MAGERLRLQVSGTVQGVGFRPHVHRLASELGLTGFVRNDTTSVCIEVQGPPRALVAFRRRLEAERPPLAHIAAIEVAAVAPVDDDGFRIEASQQVDGAVTDAPPDTAPCADCLGELADPDDRRYRYPFITCTNCGPRFTIITGLPYDRPATTMAGFPLCTACAREYHDPSDRRFHAQPLACAACGPRLRLEPPADGDSSDAVLAAVQRRLIDGEVVAVKGVGGFHLACRADDEAVVARLRARKQRPGKPFAVMVRDLPTAHRLAHLDAEEVAVLASPATPVVLVRRRAQAPLARGVAPDNPLVGIMLPASPLHHLLLHEVPGSGIDAPPALVMTSGNLSEEPICTGDEEAQERLAGIADSFLLHDRDIAVPCDDSVVRVDAVTPVGDEGVASQPSITPIRRSRGFVPAPFVLPFEGVPALAVGGELKVTTALTDGRRAWLSPHIGDMGSLASLRAFEHVVERSTTMYRVVPERLIADAHPDHATHRWAREHADGRRVVTVQHHHAHIAAVMAEHAVAPASQVLGIAFDGTGYGTDGTIWGGEVLLADYDASQRVGHLSTVLLPGGDAAIRHPHRVALSHLRSAGVGWEEWIPAVAATPPGERVLLATQLDRGVRCVPTSSVGRLFDAVASLIGVRHTVSFEAQAAIELEILAAGSEDHVALELPVTGSRDPLQLDARVLIRGVVRALRDGAAPAAIARGFHLALAEGVGELAARVRARGGPELVALSGGVFTNALLTRTVTAVLTDAGLTVLRHRLVPPTDGGLALGQLAVGARIAEDDPRRASSRHPRS